MKKSFDASFLVIAALGIAGALAVYMRDGATRFAAVFEEGLLLFVTLVPVIAVAMLLAGMLRLLLPQDRIAGWLGEESGIRGIIVSAIVGALTPSGPMVALPVAVALRAAGADIGALIAYFSGWALLAFSRMLIWEVPFVGGDFALVRFAAVLPMPVLAGLIARALFNGRRRADGGLRP